jgi:hypothetical protein
MYSILKLKPYYLANMGDIVRETLADGTIHYTRDGILHCDDGPAIVYPDGSLAWYKDGKLHNDDGHAIELPNGSRLWYQNGKYVGIAGPGETFPRAVRSNDINEAIPYTREEREYQLDCSQRTSPKYEMSDAYTASHSKCDFCGCADYSAVGRMYETIKVNCGPSTSAITTTCSSISRNWVMDKIGHLYLIKSTLGDPRLVNITHNVVCGLGEHIKYEQVQLIGEDPVEIFKQTGTFSLYDSGQIHVYEIGETLKLKKFTSPPSDSVKVSTADNGFELVFYAGGQETTRYFSLYSGSTRIVSMGGHLRIKVTYTFGKFDFYSRTFPIDFEAAKGIVRAPRIVLQATEREGKPYVAYSLLWGTLVATLTPKGIVPELASAYFANK